MLEYICDGNGLIGRFWPQILIDLPPSVVKQQQIRGAALNIGAARPPHHPVGLPSHAVFFSVLRPSPISTRCSC
jgi:hypothetical protein